MGHASIARPKHESKVSQTRWFLREGMWFSIHLAHNLGNTEQANVECNQPPSRRSSTCCPLVSIVGRCNVVNSIGTIPTYLLYLLSDGVQMFDLWFRVAHTLVESFPHVLFHVFALFCFYALVFCWRERS